MSPINASDAGLARIDCTRHIMSVIRLGEITDDGLDRAVTAGTVTVENDADAISVLGGKLILLVPLSKLERFQAWVIEAKSRSLIQAF